MRRRKLLTAALCAVLILAANTVSVKTGVNTLYIGRLQHAAAAEADTHETTEGKQQKETQNAGARTAGEPEQTAETQPPQTNPPETQPPQTNPPETQPPQTNPPEAQPPQTNPPETQPPQTNPPETQPPQTNPVTESPSTGATESRPTETLPSETVPSTETGATEQISAESGTEGSQTNPDTGMLPGDTVPETEINTEETEETESEETEQSETSLYASNEELLAHQKIVTPPSISKDFRFTQIEKRCAIVSNRSGAVILEECSEEARAVGRLSYYGCCYILKEVDGWYYVESGDVRGFVKASEVVTDEMAERIVRIKGLEELPEAKLLVSKMDNAAFTYTYTTVQEVMAEKVYALANGETAIYEQKDTSSRKTGVLADGALCYIIADETKDWVYVESSDVRGFVKKEQLITGEEAREQVETAGEKNMEQAEQLVEPEDNKACYYTLTSVREASQNSRTRAAMVEFALQFVGNPYVWGGTSLTNGADCSGFVQSIYAYFGYSLPRVAEAQAGYGMQIPISSAEPGDLIFYARNGYVYHVSMYIGDGRVVQAANQNAGIITSGIGGDAVWATRVITG